jgi:hypothetical protein
MTIYEQMIASEEYKKLFEQLPDDRKYAIQEDMKKFIDDVENKLINPLKTHMETFNKK